MRLTYVDAGEIVTTHGVRGEVKVLPWLDSPRMLCEFERCRIDGVDYKIESCRIQKTCNLLKIQGIDTMEQAQALRGKTVQIYRADVADDVIFGAELIGVSVLCEGEKIGEITEVLDYPGNSVYVVGENAYMIPAVKEFILSTDIEKNVMQVKLIEGMASNED